MIVAAIIAFVLPCDPGARVPVAAPVALSGARWAEGRRHPAGESPARRPASLAAGFRSRLRRAAAQSPRAAAPADAGAPRPTAESSHPALARRVATRRRAARGQPGLQRLARHGAHDAVHLAAVAERDEKRDDYAPKRACPAPVVYVHLHDLRSTPHRGRPFPARLPAAPPGRAPRDRQRTCGLSIDTRAAWVGVEAA
jgi:hypothetical protein